MESEIKVWNSPEGVRHTVFKGRCVTCGRYHEPSELTEALEAVYATPKERRRR